MSDSNSSWQNRRMNFIALVQELLFNLCIASLSYTLSPTNPGIHRRTRRAQSISTLILPLPGLFSPFWVFSPPDVGHILILNQSFPMTSSSPLGRNQKVVNYLVPAFHKLPFPKYIGSHSNSCFEWLYRYSFGRFRNRLSDRIVLLYSDRIQDDSGLHLNSVIPSASISTRAFSLKA